MAIDLEDNQIYYPWKNKEKKMDKQEFFDKVDEIREIVNHLFITENNTEEWQTESKKAIKMLDELREDAEQLLEDEYDLGLNRGWNHIDDEDI